MIRKALFALVISAGLSSVGANVAHATVFPNTEVPEGCYSCGPDLFDPSQNTGFYLNDGQRVAQAALGVTTIPSGVAILPSPLDSNVYTYVGTGAPVGIRYDVDTNESKSPGGLTLGGVLLTLSIYDVANNVTIVKNPQTLPGNSEYDASGFAECSAPGAGCGPTKSGAQGVLPLSSLELLGDPSFSPLNIDTLVAMLQITDPTGALLSSVTIYLLLNGGLAIPPPSVPEPASMALLGVGLAVLGVVRQRRSKGPASNDNDETAAAA